jgi:hypothetical protein
MSFLDDMNKYLINDLSKIVGEYLNPSRSKLDDMAYDKFPYKTDPNDMVPDINARDRYKARADLYNYFKCIRTDKPNGKISKGKRNYTYYKLKKLSNI